MLIILRLILPSIASFGAYKWGVPILLHSFDITFFHLAHTPHSSLSRMAPGNKVRSTKTSTPVKPKPVENSPSHKAITNQVVESKNKLLLESRGSSVKKAAELASKIKK